MEKRLYFGHHDADTLSMTAPRTSTSKEGVMLFTTTVIAATTDEALAKIDRYAHRAGVKATGRAIVRDARHHLVDVETELVGDDRNDAWVILTSYGMSPSGLGATWETVPGIGVHA